MNLFSIFVTCPRSALNSKSRPSVSVGAGRATDNLHLLAAGAKIPCLDVINGADARLRARETGQKRPAPQRWAS